MRNLEENMPIKNTTSYLFDADLRHHEDSFNSIGEFMQKKMKFYDVKKCANKQMKMKNIVLTTWLTCFLTTKKI